MNKYFTTLQNERGDVLPNYRAQVVDNTGSTVTIYSDKSGTRFTDASGNIINYATASNNGRVSFYFTAEEGQVLQTLDAAGELVDSEPDFADNFILANLPGNIAQSAVTGLTTDLAAKSATADLASTDAAKGAALVGFKQNASAVARTTQAKLRDSVNIKDFGAVGDGVTDDTTAIQAAMDWAQTQITSGSEFIPVINFPAGSYVISAKILWKAAHIVGTGAVAGTRFVWKGGAGGIMFEKDMTLWSASSHARMTDVTLQGGTAWPDTTQWPDTFVEWKNGTIDKYAQLLRVQFTGCLGDAVKIPRWTNLHWEDLRWDFVGGYAVSALLEAGMSYRSFVIRRFTYHGSNSTGITATGFLKLDNTVGVDPGIVVLADTRIESDAAWTNNCLVASIGTGNIRYKLDNVELQVPGTPALIKHSGTLSAPTVSISDLDASTYAFSSGDILTTYPTVPAKKWATLAVNGSYANGTHFNTDGTALGLVQYSGTGGGIYPVQSLRGAEAFPRYRRTDTGVIQLGSGTAAPDISLGYFSGFLQVTTGSSPLRGMIPSFSGMTLGTASFQWKVFASEVLVGGVKVVGAQQPANPDTSGATLAALETEVNELKAVLRAHGLIAT